MWSGHSCPLLLTLKLHVWVGHSCPTPLTLTLILILRRKPGQTTEACSDVKERRFKRRVGRPKK